MGKAGYRLIGLILMIAQLVLPVCAEALNNAAANTEIVAHWKNQPELRLLPYLYHWTPEQPADIATATSKVAEFIPVDGATRIAALDREVWYRTRLHSNSDAVTILFFNQLLIKNIDLYWRDSASNNAWQNQTHHFHIPPSERDIPHPFFAFKLSLKKDQTIDLYFRAHSLPSTFATIDPLLMTESYFIQAMRTHDKRAALLIGFSLCLFFIMLFFIPANLPTTDAFIFLLLPLAGIMVILCYDGVFLDLPNGEKLTHFFSRIIVSLNVSLILLFCTKLMDMKQYMPWLYRAFIFGIVFFLGIALTRATGILSNPLLNFASLNSTFLLIGLLSALVIRSTMLRRPYTGLFMLGIVIQLGVLLLSIYANSYKDGRLPIEWRSLQYIGQPMLTAVWALALFRKITDQAREDRLRNQQAELLAQQAQLRTDFLFNMSHEIRTPINGVLGMTQLLEQTPLNPGQRHYLDVLKNAGNTLLRVINDILDLAKLDAGKLDVEKVPVNLDQLMVDTVELFSPMLRKKRLAFSYEAAADIPMHILGDPTRISQVLTNLLGNAVKFTEEGSIRFLANHAPGSTTEQPRLRFEIIDTGIGITEEAQQRLFLAFEQAERSMTRRFGGTGLGLSICKKIIELMHGEIGVDSEPGKGSRFYFELPIEIDHHADSIFHNRLEIINGKHCIMVINDDPTLHFYRHALDHWQAVTDTLTPSDEPCAVQDWPAIDLLILPAQLPAERMDQWMSAASTQHIPVVIIVPRHNPDQLIENIKNRPAQILNPPAGYTRFAEKLAASLSPGSATESQQPTVLQFDDFHLLIAEDNEVNTLVMKSLLKRHNLSADYVANGALAVNRYRENPQRFSAILMDCEMPVMDGFDATRTIRYHEAEQQLPAIPIIALTAHALQETRDNCLAAGMNDVITKPINFQHLLLQLQKLANNRRH